MIECRHLIHPNVSQIQQIQQIYESNFPASERKPFPELLYGCQSGMITLLVAEDNQPHERIVGIALLLALPDTSAMYLPYIAITRAQQNEGLGSALFRYMVSFLAQYPDHIDALVWEVEPPVLNAPRHIQNRRIHFYQRLGAQIVTEAPDYCMPNLEGEGVVPLRLMWVAIGNHQGPTLQDTISWIRGIYDVAYSDYSDLCDRIIATVKS